MLLSLAGAATSTIFVATKVLSCDKTFVLFVATKRLSRQIFVATNKILSQQIFATTNIILSRQNDKHTFVATNTCSVATKVCFILLAAPASDSILLSREKIQSKLVATKQCLSRRKCREKYTFIATKNLSR